MISNSSKKIHYISLDRLLLDPKNPRVDPRFHGKDQAEILKYMERKHALDDLALSFVTNMYFEEEPVIIIPEKASKKENFTDFITLVQDEKVQFIVAEGNRRVATLKILIDRSLASKSSTKNWPELSEENSKTLQKIPCIIYPDRQSLRPYLGVRHITGVKKWDPLEKAAYISQMIDDGMTIEQVENMVGNRAGTILKSYVAYKIVELTEGEVDSKTTEKASDYFSYLLVSLNHSNIKNYMNIELSKDKDKVIKSIGQNKENIHNLLSFIYGDKDKQPVIKESRQLQDKLSPVLASKVATESLLVHRNIDKAYDMSEGDLVLLKNYLIKIEDQLTTITPLINKYKDSPDIKPILENVNNAFEVFNKIARD